MSEQLDLDEQLVEEIEESAEKLEELRRKCSPVGRRSKPSKIELVDRYDSEVVETVAGFSKKFDIKISIVYSAAKKLKPVASYRCADRKKGRGSKLYYVQDLEKACENGNAEYSEKTNKEWTSQDIQKAIGGDPVVVSVVIKLFGLKSEGKVRVPGAKRPLKAYKAGDARRMCILLNKAIREHKKESEK